MSSKDFCISGKELKKALIDLDLSYMDVAKAMGCSVIYIREIAVDTRKAVTMRKRIAYWLAAQYKKNNYKAPGWAKEKAA